MNQPRATVSRTTTCVVAAMLGVFIPSGPAAPQSRQSCESIDPSWSPDGFWIVFASNCEGNLDLYQIRPNGSELKRLTRTAGAEHTPRWSPDGRRIAYAYDDSAAQADIRVMNADGSDLRVVTSSRHAHSNPTWSPDGRRIAYESRRDKNADIFVLDLASRMETRLTISESRDVAPAWSPNSDLVAFQSNREGRYAIYAVGVAGGSSDRPIIRTSDQAVAPAWSPDGHMLTFACRLEGERDTEVCTARSDGTGLEPLTRNDRDDFAPSYAPDGRRIVFMAARPQGGWELRVLSLHDPSETVLPLPGDSAASATARAESDRPRAKPNVAILVFDGVQVIDHAIPFEVFGQYGLNNVFTVAKDSTALTTYMGMRILPNHTFGDHPVPDVLVIPGGDARRAREDPAIREWIRRNAAMAKYVVSTCVGAFFLADAGLLDGRAATTWYARLNELARAAPGIRVLPSELVVQDGKIVTSNGTGLEPSLHVLALLHGEAWANLVRLNMEYEPIPEAVRVPRAELADLELPSGLYVHFPWRDADLLQYEGDRERWTMRWYFESPSPMDSLTTRFRQALTNGDGWTVLKERRGAERWTADWRHESARQERWRRSTELKRVAAGKYELTVRVER